MENKIFDILIIGSGPAGLTAAIYAARREMRALVIGKELGGQVMWASEIENYPGFKNIQATDLIFKIQEQVTNLGVTIENTEIKKIEKKKDIFFVYSQNNIYQAKTILVAMGLSPRRLEIPGEIEFGGRGVTYCANCDGPFYKNKTVAVVGGGNAALDAAEVLSKIANQVYLIHRNDQFKAFDALVSEVKSKPNIEMLTFSNIKEIKGQQKVESILVKGESLPQEREIKVDGVFIEIGRIAHTDLVADFVELNQEKQIVVDRLGQTKTEGMFAAGDVTDTPYKQITVAMGSATIAALSAYQYLQLKQGKKIVPILDRSLPKA